MSKSIDLFEKSKKIIPGGVHSPVRSFKGLARTPLFFEKGNAAFLYDIEGKNYIDFCMSFGPLILGHTDPAIKEALTLALEKGWSYGACEPYSLELAEFLTARLPFIDQIRFVNSGTEAVMTAIRLARGFTGKNKILKFESCYHGHTDSMLIKAGSGLAGTATGSSAGIPLGVSHDTLICELNNIPKVEEIFSVHGKDIAAVIIEPLPANNGLITLPTEFLNFLRQITQKHNALLIFDEVISGFRVGFGGMAERLNIKPDLVTYGKIIGGGMPVGAIAGKKDIMQCLAPVGNVYQAGTLSGNPLAMVAGLATLKKLDTAFYKNLNSLTEKIVTLFEHWLKKQSVDYKLPWDTGLFWIETKEFEKIFLSLLEKGIYLAPNAYEVGFTSCAHETVLPELEKRLC